MKENSKQTPSEHEKKVKMDEKESGRAREKRNLGILRQNSGERGGLEGCRNLGS